MATRSRKEHMTYKKYLRQGKTTDCVFCSINKGEDQLIKQTKHFKIIKNVFPYSIWDETAVIDHIMITPIQHTDNLNKLSDEARINFVKLLSEYESKGYSFYGRAPASHIKSVYHQHTHLIKIGPKRKWLIFISFKPYLRISK